MKMYLRGGPLDGKEFTVSRYLPAWDIPYPFTNIQPARSIEHYQQHPIERHVYEHIGSRPYYLHGERK